MKLIRDKIKRDTYMVSKLSGMISRGELRENHPQQRKSGQWNNEVRDNFIVTVIKNEDFDAIKICEQLTEKGIVLWLIDGLQRSTTIANYKAGKFKLGRKIDPYLVEYQDAIKDEEGNITYEIVEYDLRGKSYKDLPEKLKEDFDNCPVDVVKHLDCTDEEVGRHIVRYNSGRAMVAAQKISAYMYNTAKYVKDLSGHAFFNDCANYSESADKNGTVDKVISEAIMGLNFFDSWNKDAKKIGKHLNDNATEEMFAHLKGYLDELLEVITPETGKLFTPKNALIWIMLFDRFKKSGLPNEKFQEFLEQYDDAKRVKIKIENSYEIVKGSGDKTNFVSFAELDGWKSTKDKGIIVDKLYILETVMNEYLHINKEDFQSETALEEVDTLEFVKENVKSDATEEDIEFYSEMLDGLTLEVDNNTKLLDEHNRPSLVALVAYACENDIDLDEWIKSYFAANVSYILNQQQNYIHMISTLKGAIA